MQHNPLIESYEAIKTWLAEERGDWKTIKALSGLSTRTLSKIVNDPAYQPNMRTILTLQKVMTVQSICQSPDSSSQ